MDLIEVDTIVGQVFDILQPLANAAGMRLVHDRSQSVAVMGDAPLISGAVLNLVSNAIKYSPDTSEISIHAEVTDGHMLTSVIDHGIGIPRDEIIAGERRWRASKLAGKETIPAIVERFDDATAHRTRQRFIA